MNILNSAKSRIWMRRTWLTRSPTFGPVVRVALQAFSALCRANPLQSSGGRVKSLRYLNVGCGRKPNANFVNLDYSWYPGVDLVSDITKPLPFPSNSLKGIFTEHCLEHLPFDAVRRHVLVEFFRVLSPGGVLRIVVPDGGLYLRLYAEARAGVDVMFPNVGAPLKTPIMHVNRCFRDHGHLYCYDFETMREILVESGFETVTLQSFNSGIDAILLIDSEERAPESLYVEAVK